MEDKRGEICKLYAEENVDSPPSRSWSSGLLLMASFLKIEPDRLPARMPGGMGSGAENGSGRCDRSTACCGGDWAAYGRGGKVGSEDRKPVTSSIELPSHIDRADEGLLGEQFAEPRASVSEPHVGAKAAQGLERKSRLVDVEFPRVEVKHRHGRRALVPDLFQRQSRQEEREESEVASSAHRRVDAADAKRGWWNL